MNLGLWCSRIILTILLTASINEFLSAEEFNYGSINSTVVDKLINLEKNLTEWAEELAGMNAVTLDEAGLQLNVCIRSGNQPGAIGALKAMRKIIDQQYQAAVESKTTYRMPLNHYFFDETIRMIHTNDNAIARMIFELFPYETAPLSNITITLFRGTEGNRNQPSFSDQQFANWLHQRYLDTLIYEQTRPVRDDIKLRFILPDHDQSTLWQLSWLEQLKRMGTLDAQMTKMEAAVLDAPNDPEIVKNYLFLMYKLYSYDEPGNHMSPNLLRILESVSLSRAVDNRSVGETLMDFQLYKNADYFLAKALKQPLTDEEIALLSFNYQMILPAETHKLMFKISLLEKRSECMVEQNEPAKAQQFMEEAAKIRKENYISMNYTFSGAIQSFTGQRTIENEIKEQEVISPDDPVYWQNRADYYRGRNEPAQQEEALRKALDLCNKRMHNLSEQHNTEPGVQDIRPQIVLALVELMNDNGRTKESLAMTEEELKASPVDNVLMVWLVSYRLNKLNVPIAYDDSVLWDYLTRIPNWEFTAEQVLWKLLKCTPDNLLDQQLLKAERLALEPKPNPERLLPLGWVENRIGQFNRSIPVLKKAIEILESASMTDYETQRRLNTAYFTLFESYLDLGQWRQAELQFVHAQKQLSPDEKPHWLNRVAEKAEAAGDLDDAARIRNRIANTGVK